MTHGLEQVLEFRMEDRDTIDDRKKEDEFVSRVKNIMQLRQTLQLKRIKRWLFWSGVFGVCTFLVSAQGPFYVLWPRVGVGLALAFMLAFVVLLANFGVWLIGSRSDQSTLKNYEEKVKTLEGSRR